MTSQVVQNVEQAVEQVAPTSPVVEVAEAAVSTAADPSVPNILSDIELLLSLGKQIKTLAATHPTLSAILQELF